jgi:hypothetical protein
MTPLALELRYAILAIVGRLGEATPLQIADALTEHHKIPTKRANLPRTLRQLVRAQLLRNVARGVYGLSVNYGARGRQSSVTRDRTPPAES